MVFDILILIIDIIIFKLRINNNKKMHLNSLQIHKRSTANQILGRSVKHISETFHLRNITISIPSNHECWSISTIPANINSNLILSKKHTYSEWRVVSSHIPYIAIQGNSILAPRELCTLICRFRFPDCEKRNWHNLHW